jgi:predicted methyltransferase
MVAGLVAACDREAPPAPPPATARVSSADYDRWRRPDLLLAALELGLGQRVADVGAGRGYLTHRLAAAVGPAGRVVATDVDAAALAAIGPDRAGSAPIERRVVEPRDPGLEPGRYHRVLLAQVDHLLADRVAFLTAVRRALVPGGRVLVSNRLPHRAGLLAAVEPAGFRVVAERDLPGQFAVVLAAGPAIAGRR